MQLMMLMLPYYQQSNYLSEAIEVLAFLLYDYETTDYVVSLDARKPVFGVSDQVRHKPACTSSEKS